MKNSHGTSPVYFPPICRSDSCGYIISPMDLWDRMMDLWDRMIDLWDKLFDQFHPYKTGPGTMYIW